MFYTQLFHVSAECMTYLRLTSLFDNVTYSISVTNYISAHSTVKFFSVLEVARGHVYTYDIIMLNTEQPTVAASLLKCNTL